MLRLVADENLNGSILRGLLSRRPDLDIVRVQDVGLAAADDVSILEWAAREGRGLITHDINTVTRHAYDRIRANQPMSGVFVVGHTVSIGRAIEDILLLTECSQEGEWEGQVRYLPL